MLFRWGLLRRFAPRNDGNPLGIIFDALALRAAGATLSLAMTEWLVAMTVVDVCLNIPLTPLKGGIASLLHPALFIILNSQFPIPLPLNPLKGTFASSVSVLVLRLSTLFKPL